MIDNNIDEILEEARQAKKDAQYEGWDTYEDEWEEDEWEDDDE